MKTNIGPQPGSIDLRFKLATIRKALEEQLDTLGNLIEGPNDNDTIQKCRDPPHPPRQDTSENHKGYKLVMIREALWQQFGTLFGILGTLINEFDSSSEHRTRLHPELSPKRERSGSPEDTKRITKEERKTTQKDDSESTTILHCEQEKEQGRGVERAMDRIQDHNTLKRTSTDTSRRVTTLRLVDVGTIFAFCTLVFVTQHGVTLCVMGHVVIFTKILLLIINHLSRLAALRRWFFGAPVLCRRKDV
ncbi:hypothetical protein GQX73_g10611 [Xylaria multiplex]|uniref:Uncharacterized protein n=1 Tax=Xylaria multiplex TaxID=323545 RepID=A0A7C8MWU9_9PEZI|nr:hypothetical protein GQX73_g10611 [Xylaria multiplex]